MKGLAAERPLRISHGAADTRVNVRESEQSGLLDRVIVHTSAAGPDRFGRPSSLR